MVQHSEGRYWVAWPCVEDTTRDSTLGTQCYACIGEWVRADLSGFSPTSVQYVNTTVVNLSSGPSQQRQGARGAEEFWNFLCGWGGEWLWDHMYTPFGLDAIFDAVASRTAI